MSVRVSVELGSSLTWDDLYMLTDLARAAAVPGSQPVGFVVDEESFEVPFPESMYVDVEPEHLEKVRSPI